MVTLSSFLVKPPLQTCNGTLSRSVSPHQSIRCIATETPHLANDVARFDVSNVSLKNIFHIHDTLNLQYTFDCFVYGRNVVHFV